MQTRRGFCKTAGFGALAVAGSASVLTSVGCNAGNLFSQILAYVNVGLQAFQAIEGILTSVGVIPPAVASIMVLVKAGFADLQTAVNDYNAATGDKTTLLGKISTVLAVLQTRLSTFWDDLHLPAGNLSSVIQGLLGVILTTLAYFASKLPAPAAKAKLNAHAAKLMPIERTPQQVKDDVNAILNANGFSQFAVR